MERKTCDFYHGEKGDSLTINLRFIARYLYLIVTGIELGSSLERLAKQGILLSILNFVLTDT
ncbi:hypothetical protein IQ264_04145 [Phormidium sp. LEGE 05292]|uniref:hypothetical protein n=1 Tax=[Phormidium] sp. LEGE 05292 TaxID=767427 RepID=UPI00187F540C|nr:hypothetical protein [Phormidium sp. LEGE 05292]MBE9224661.1 hypothetical protein [Phormidium sp. LEGE 05292]